MNGELTYPARNCSPRGSRDTLDGRCYGLLSRSTARRDLYDTATGPTRGNTEGLPPEERTVRFETVSTRIEPADRRRTYKSRPQGYTNGPINLGQRRL
jgi:hypothetical protein